MTQPELPSPECLLVIDSGFSFTHVVPILRGSVVWEAVRRLLSSDSPPRRCQLKNSQRVNVGGKLLTNHLKELVSFRQWDMMEQTRTVGCNGPIPSTTASLSFSCRVRSLKGDRPSSM